MRPTSFDPSVLRRHLRRHKISELVDLKRALGTDTDLTVFRKLKQLGYHASYTHRGRFYTLAEIARFDDRGLWSHETVWFSKHDVHKRGRNSNQGVCQRYEQRTRPYRT